MFVASVFVGPLYCLKIYYLYSILSGIMYAFE